MRKRDRFVGLWVDDAEYQQLARQSAISGLTISAFIRHCVLDVKLRPRPPDTYAALLRELSAIGNNVNQIAYWANARKGVTDAEVQETSALVRQAWRLVKDTL